MTDNKTSNQEIANQEKPQQAAEKQGLTTQESNALKTTKQAAGFSDTSLKQEIGDTRAALKRSHEGAAEALVGSYLIYRAVSSGDANKWFLDEVKAYNDKIKTHNDKIDAHFKRADDFMAGKLHPTDFVNKQPKNDEEKAEQEKARQQLRVDHKLTKAQRNRLKAVPATARDKTSSFTVQVKFIFELHRSSDAPQVLRYCSVHEWLHARYGKIANPNRDELKQEIIKRGGISAVADEYRESQRDENAAKNKKKEEAVIQTNAVSKLKDMEPKASVPVAARNSKDGFVLLLGRTNGGAVEVLGEAELGETDIQKAVNKMGSKERLDIEAPTEFVGRALTIAGVIQDGLIVPLDDGTGGKTTTQRTLSMIPNENGDAHLVFSVKRAEASSVLHARPRDTGIMGSGEEYGVLDFEDRKLLEEYVKDPVRRCLINIKAIPQPKTAGGKPAKSPLAWGLENIALKDIKGNIVAKQIFWNQIKNQASKPLDIYHFDPQFEGQLTKTAMLEILGLLPELKPGKRLGEKDPKTINFKFKSNKLSVVYGDHPALELDLKSPCTETVTVRVRAQDIHDLFTHLRELDFETVKFAGDTSGLVHVGWEDAFGFYDFYMPACSTDARLLARCIAPIRLKAPALMAAE